MHTLRPLFLVTCLSLTLALSPAGPATKQPLSPRAAETYAVDAVHSAVIFRCKHMEISQAYGRFNRILEEKSKVVYDPDDISKSSILLVIDAASIDTANANRDQHLKSPDFLSVQENPEIVFESKKISGTPEALALEGDLTLRGVTKPVKAKATVVGRGEVQMRETSFRAGFEAHFTVDMREFGFDFVKQNPGAVGPEVDLTVSLECVRK